MASNDNRALKQHEKLRDVTRYLSRPRLLAYPKKVQHTRQILWYYQAYYFTLIQGICTHGVQRCVGMLAINHDRSET
jgi:hypothetical protein